MRTTHTHTRTHTRTHAHTHTHTHTHAHTHTHIWVQRLHYRYEDNHRGQVAVEAVVVIKHQPHALTDPLVPFDDKGFHRGDLYVLAFVCACFLSVCLPACMCACMHACMYVCMYACVHARISYPNRARTLYEPMTLHLVSPMFSETQSNTEVSQHVDTSEGTRLSTCT